MATEFLKNSAIDVEEGPISMEKAKEATFLLNEAINKKRKGKLSCAVLIY
jgi:hypothetical protein